MSGVLEFPQQELKCYEDFYTFKWRTSDGEADEFSFVLMVINVLLLLATLVLLLYARAQIDAWDDKELPLRRIGVYVNVIFAHIFLYLALLVAGGTSQNACLIAVLLLMFFALAAASWLMSDALSMLLSVLMPKKQLVALYYCIVGWGFPLVVVLAYLGYQLVAPESIISIEKCWFRDELAMPMTSAPLGLVFVVHIASVILSSTCEAESPLSSKQVLLHRSLAKRSSVWNFLLLTLPIYSGVLCYSMLWVTDNVLFEYIFIASLSLQSLLLFLRYIICDPMVKNSIVDTARQQYDEKQSRKLPNAPRMMYIP